jgi:hypothetical protein
MNIYCGSGLAIKVGELGVLGVDFFCVNSGISLKCTVPPVHLPRELLHTHMDELLLVLGLEGPERVVDIDFFGEVSVDELVSVQVHGQMLDS